MKAGTIPHLRVVVAFCLIAIVGYAVFSWYAVFIANDATMTGDVIGTWKSFAVLAFGFWLGSSSAGKAKEGEPVKTEIVNTPAEPVPTTSAFPEPAYGGKVDEPDQSTYPAP